MVRGSIKSRICTLGVLFNTICFNVDCRLLTLVSIGEGSFSEGSEFVLEKNPSLVTLIVHKGAFGSGKIDESSVTLSGIIDKYELFNRFTFT